MVKERIIVYGAGWTGEHIATSLKDSKHLYQAVCFLDDDDSKHGRSVKGIKVYGGREKLSKAIKKFDATRIVIAMPSVSYERKKEIYKLCLEQGIKTTTIPDLPSLVTNADLFSQRKEIKKEDLICRNIIEFDTKDIEELIKGSVCLVTGAGGSIGSELSRQIAKYNPKKIILLDIYENGVFHLNLELEDKYKDINTQVEIVSVTDYEACKKLFADENIDLIFHAAAHKHVPLMEHNPSEAIKNNIVGTWNMADLASKHNVKKMVLVSTDKAVNPTNVMGATKRFCEKIMIYFSYKVKTTKYAMVRFGNVIGSHGSVFHIFNKQIESGGPVTITHKDIIRYFMTIPEAASLILQCGAFAEDGEVFILDMGEPVRIIELAEKMIRLSGYEPYKDIDIKEIGLRPGEKLFEEILMDTENMKKTANGKIYVGRQKENVSAEFENQYKEIVHVAKSNDEVGSVNILKKYVETYKVK